MSKRQLNIFQRSIIQRIAFGIVYFVSIILTGFFADFTERKRFITIFEKAQQQGLINSDGFQTAKNLIESMSWIESFVPVAIVVLCVLVSLYALKWVVNRNWSWPTTLPKAVEFRFAMRKLGIADPAEWVPFICKNDIPVFIAVSPLIGDEQENVRVRRYSRAPNRNLISKKVFELNTGKQTLCLDTDDYEHLLEQHGPKTKSAYHAKIAELEEKITEIKALNSAQRSDITKLSEDNKKLLTENTEHRRKQKTAAARERKAEKREIAKVPFWLVAVPLIYRLKAEAGPGTSYTSRQIQEDFLQELEKYPELKPEIERLLRSSKKESENTPFSLDGWAMEAIRSALGDLARKEGGRPRSKA